MISSRILLFFLSLFLVGSFVSAERPPGRDAVLLSNVQSLTLHADRLTNGRRVAAIPQLKCIGPSRRTCKMNPVDVMRCTNQGFDYDEEDVQWTCTASLPPEFKLGSTNVVCEGYRSSRDKWILKGSCGVEYRLLLTELGEQRFGYTGYNDQWTNETSWPSTLFLILFVGCLALILFPLLRDCCFGGDRRRDNNNTRRGGGGGGGGGDPRGPPPPYNYYDSPRTNATFSAQPWRPGFWTGAFTGAAAGYQFGRSGPNNSSYLRRPSSNYRFYNGSGEGSSTRSPERPSTGFGSTRRR